MIARSTTGSEPAIARGRVQLLARRPVKSLGGENLAASRLDGRGFAGDRADAFFELREDGTTLRRLTARQAPQTLRWTAAYSTLPDDRLGLGTPPSATVTAPDGRAWTTEDPGLAASQDKPGVARASASHLRRARRPLRQQSARERRRPHHPRRRGRGAHHSGRRPLSLAQRTLRPMAPQSMSPAIRCPMGPVTSQAARRDSTRRKVSLPRLWPLPP